MLESSGKALGFAYYLTITAGKVLESAGKFWEVAGLCWKSLECAGFCWVLLGLIRGWGIDGF